MKGLILPVLLLLSQHLLSQSSAIDTSINLDVLRSPSSPAFNILGIAPSEIERPTDIKAFALSLQNATGNFTSIPNSYAFEVAPFLLKRRKFTLNAFDSNAYTFQQSLILSAGYTHMGPEGYENIDSLKITKFGFGVKFSIIRPKWTGNTRTAYNSLVAAQKQLLKDYRLLESRNENARKLDSIKGALKALETTQLTPEERKARTDTLDKQFVYLDSILKLDLDNQIRTSSLFYEQVKQEETNFKSERKGLFLDFSSGFALSFPDNRFNNSKVYRGGAWLTGGRENGNKGISYLFVARYLYQPETAFADPGNTLKPDNLSTFDAGIRLLITAAKGRFSFSGESLYRSILSKSEINPSWRLVFNTDYDIGINKKITFSFGRDFDGTISKGGNLVAALNFIAGFGLDRKVF